MVLAMRHPFGVVARMVIVLCVALLCHTSFADINDKVLRFSSTGIDRYADGSPVADGECYALVWSPKGSTFAGFNADGTAISPTDRVVLAGPLAKDGKCRDAIFQIPAATYDELAGGEWAVCLVDTRTMWGVPAGTKNGVPVRVNRWGLVDSAIKIEPASASMQSVASPKSAFSLPPAAAGGDSGKGSCAETLSKVPDYVGPPLITSFDVADGVVRLTVANTVPFLTYGVASGDTPGEMSADPDAGIADGAEGRLLEFEIMASGVAKFFKITRAEWGEE